MSLTYFTPLPRAILSVAGEDRRAFLQGLISNDITKATPDRAIWAALLTAQGKFLHDLFIVEKGDALLIDVEAARLAEFAKKLSMYKLRSKVTIAAADGLNVFAAFGDGALAALGLVEAGAAVPFADGIAFGDPRAAAMGARVYVGSADALSGFTEAPFAAWDEARIRQGVPDGSRDMPVEKALLLENGFEELGGVDFQKGCYMGQELTARTKYRGLVRKRLLPVTISGPSPEPGSMVMAGEVEAGEMRSVQGDVGLALLRLDHVRSGAALTTGGATVTPAVPDWMVLPEAE
jgi:folate-binding protein YgfZ